MKNENNIKKIVDDHKITEEDLYFLSHIEGIKATAGIFKEKYNKYMYGILKKYNVNSIAFLMISRYVKEKKFHLVPELIEKYGPYQLDSSKTSYDFKGIKAFAILLIVIIVSVFMFKSMIKNNETSKQYGYEENGVYAVITMGNNLCNIIVASSNENIIKTKGTYSINNNNVEFNWDNSFGPKEALISNQNGEEVLIVSGPEGDAVYKKIEK